MTLSGRLSHLLVLAAPLVAALATAAPVHAAQAEVALLQSYIGSWKGQGVLTGPEPEIFTCRLSVTKGNQDKINYLGRCALAGMNLSVAGSIVYVDAVGRYEAAMTSNATFSGTAIGKKQGSSVVFDLKERNADEKGNDMTVASQIVLQDGKIIVDFNVVFDDSGETMKASVPFSK